MDNRDRYAAIRQVFAAIEAHHEDDVGGVNEALRGMDVATAVVAHLMVEDVLARALADRLGTEVQQTLAQVQQKILLDLEYEGGER